MHGDSSSGTALFGPHKPGLERLIYSREGREILLLRVLLCQAILLILLGDSRGAQGTGLYWETAAQLVLWRLLAFVAPNGNISVFN